MSKLVWDKAGEHFYETGISKCVLYTMTDGVYDKGVAWNGITSVSENPSGADASKIYADNINYLNLYSVEDFGATIEAYTYPDEFMACDGSAVVNNVFIGQQTRKSFGLCYRTVVGNDDKGEDYGYKLHIIYNCKASPSQRQYQTINDSPDAISFSWEITTIPVAVTIDGTEYKPTSTLVLDSHKVGSNGMKAVEKLLYGTDGTNSGGSTTAGTDPKLPSPSEIIDAIKAADTTSGS